MDIASIVQTEGILNAHFLPVRMNIGNFQIFQKKFQKCINISILCKILKQSSEMALDVATPQLKTETYQQDTSFKKHQQVLNES